MRCSGLRIRGGVRDSLRWAEEKGEEPMSRMGVYNRAVVRSVGFASTAVEGWFRCMDDGCPRYIARGVLRSCARYSVFDLGGMVGGYMILTN